jgi:signal transduction histidine kinase
MSIKLRLALLLGLLLLVFGFCVFALRALETRQLAEAIAVARRDDIDLVENWIDLRAASLRRFVDDTARWDDLASYVASPSARAEWPANHLDPQLARYGIDLLWLARPDGTLLHTSARPGTNSIPIPVPSSHLAELHTTDTSIRAYFHPCPAGLLEVRAVKLPGAPSAWLFAARIWDERFLTQLGDLTDSTASLSAVLQALPQDPDAPAPIVVQRTLPAWDGSPLVNLRLLRTAPDISFRVEADRLKTRVFLVFGFCLIAALAVSLHRWVLQPLGWITDSLIRNDPAPIQPLLHARTELTRVARLIVNSFEHQKELRREVAERRHAEAELQRTLEERARLGRDLHDGVIQSIYAAGMGLAAARKRMPSDPAAAERHLAHVADVLNDTIHDVRDFITGLEPESLRADAFAHSVSNLFATMNAADAARAIIEIENDTALRLPAPLRTDLLLVLREAISNALRHGQATLVTIRLKSSSATNGFALLSIEDDGAGFDPATVRRGRGLDNLFARTTACGAKIHLDSAPAAGTRLTLTLPLLNPD